MKRIFLVLIFILSCYIFTVNSQTSSFLNNLTPLLKITRLFMSELVRPQTFNAGYQASKKINVSMRGRKLLTTLLTTFLKSRKFSQNLSVNFFVMLMAQGEGVKPHQLLYIN